MSLHHASITLKVDCTDHRSLDEHIAHIQTVREEITQWISAVGVHVEHVDPSHLRIYGTSEQIGFLVQTLLEENHLQSLRIEPLEKIPYAETGSGD